jgi:excisionase family DNA binding protein
MWFHIKRAIIKQHVGSEVMDDTRERVSPPKTISVPQAGREYYGVGKNLAYKLAQEGKIPVIQVGRLLRVPVAAMERKLESVG